MSVSPIIKPANLKLWLPFSEGTGTSCADRSGTGNTGTFSNSPSWTTSKIGKGILFNNSNQSVSVASHSSLSFEYNNPFTCAAWVKLNTNTTGSRFIITKEVSGSTYRGYAFYLTEGRVGLVKFYDVSGGLYNSVYETTASVTINRWFFVCCTTAAGSATLDKVYTNGVVASAITTGQNALSTNTMVNSTALLIGNRGVEANFNGIIAHPMVWNTELTAKEISLLYHSTKGAYLL